MSHCRRRRDDAARAKWSTQDKRGRYSYQKLVFSETSRSICLLCVWRENRYREVALAGSHRGAFGTGLPRRLQRPLTVGTKSNPALSFGTKRSTLGSPSALVSSFTFSRPRLAGPGLSIHLEVTLAVVRATNGGPLLSGDALPSSSAAAHGCERAANAGDSLCSPILYR